MRIKPGWPARIEIPYLRGGRAVLETPTNDDELDQACRLITDELQVRRERNPGKKGSAAVNKWLGPPCYRLIIACHSEEEGGDLLENRIVRNKRYGRGRPASLHIFQTGLLAIFAHVPTLLGEQERKRLADRMWHAFRHYIPPPLLEGFNHQYPRHTDTGHDWLLKIEPELLEWVVGQRALAVIGDDEVSDLRRQYPDKVERSVTQIVEEADADPRSLGREPAQYIRPELDDGWS